MTTLERFHAAAPLFRSIARVEGEVWGTDGAVLVKLPPDTPEFDGDVHKDGLKPVHDGVLRYLKICRGEATQIIRAGLYVTASGLYIREYVGEDCKVLLQEKYVRMFPQDAFVFAHSTRSKTFKGKEADGYVASFRVKDEIVGMCMSCLDLGGMIPVPKMPTDRVLYRERSKT